MSPRQKRRRKVSAKAALGYFGTMVTGLVIWFAALHFYFFGSLSNSGWGRLLTGAAVSVLLVIVVLVARATRSLLPGIGGSLGVTIGYAISSLITDLEHAALVGIISMLFISLPVLTAAAVAGKIWRNNP